MYAVVGRRVPVREVVGDNAVLGHDRVALGAAGDLVELVAVVW